MSMKAINGVDSVKVSLATGLTSVTLKPGNTATLQQFQEAITRNGFTMKQSNIVVAGKILAVGGKDKLQVSGSNEVLNLDANAQNLQSYEGKNVVITGVVPEPAKKRAPDTVRVEKIVEGQ
ncbi:MAG: heavy-metal-associated domain-containing protein [Acidobacteriaceae bacterium]